MLIEYVIVSLVIYFFVGVLIACIMDEITDMFKIFTIIIAWPLIILAICLIGIMDEKDGYKEQD